MLGKSKMVTSVVLPRVTHEKFNMYKSGLESMESLSPEVANTILSMFSQIFEYDPSLTTYSKDIYEKSKQRNLEKTGGKSSVSDAHVRANKKYNETHREEINKRERERYHKKKLEKQMAQMNLITNLIETQ